jgi:hypothetical protein
MNATAKRLNTIRELLCFTAPIETLSLSLKEFEWDWEGETISLTREHLRDVLQRYRSSSLPGADIETWANLIEGREDISFEPAFESALADILNQLANPLLTAALDEEKAAAFIQILSLPESSSVTLAARMSRVCDQLGLAADPAFVAHLSTGRKIQAITRIRHVGDRNGMLIVSSWSDIQTYTQELAQDGYGYSVLSVPVTGGNYDIESYIEMFRDWGWWGPAPLKPDLFE